MSNPYNEDNWERWTLELLAELDWEIATGASLAPGSGERESWKSLVLMGTLRDAVRRLNPEVPVDYLEQAISEVLEPNSQEAIAENHRLHDILINGYRGITYIGDGGVETAPTIRFLSDRAERNSYLAANQLIVRNRDFERRFDVVLFINGLPLVVIELKKASSKATAESAFHQLQTYRDEFPMVFRFVEFVIASDGVDALYGTPFTPWNHFAPWNVDDDGRLVGSDELDIDGRPVSRLSLAIHGLANLERILQLIRDFIAFDETAEGFTKRMAKPHQYFAVTKAVGSTVTAQHADGRIGVVWHTQGSGKSMEMELYTAKVMRHPKLASPTVIVITDRQELDTQLFDGFARSNLLPEAPQQISSRDELREVLSSRQSGGIYFTTLQKFGKNRDERELKLDHPTLSERRNIIVMADEAHRSHYGNLDGYAANLKSALPNASLIAFTGTPISDGERDTRRVFGDDIDVYDLLRAVEDGATVPVGFEPRLIKLMRDGDIDDETIDDAAEEATAGLDDADRERLQRQVLRLETVYGAPERVRELARDVIRHWEDRREAMRPFIGCSGKALIVCATRSIAAALYEEIIALRPDWHSDADDKGKIKVVYDASPSDPDALKKHMRRPGAMKAVKKRVKNPDDELELVIVKDMMLTGFDAPCLHTLYIDRPLKGALLMQTLARVNRTFRGKQDGLLVAYAPLTDNLEAALKEYTRPTQGPGGEKVIGQTAEDAANIVRELLGQLDALAGEPWSERVATFRPGTSDFLNGCMLAVTRLRSPQTPGNTHPEDPEARPLADAFRALAAKLARAWSMAAGHPDADATRDAVKFYYEMRSWMAKLDAQERRGKGQPVPEDIQRLLGDLVLTMAVSDGVMDIYEAAGLPYPALSNITPELIEEVSDEPSKAQLAIEALKAQLFEEVRKIASTNPTRGKLFSERANELMVRYVNQQLTAAEVLTELKEMAHDVRDEHSRGQQFSPPLIDDELAFYDVVAENESALDVMGTDVLACIARELVATMRKETRVDWTVRDDVRAKLRSSVKRLLRKYGYPPDQQKEAVAKVIEQMEAFGPKYAEENGGEAAG